jgi:hypothetical protein
MFMQQVTDLHGLFRNVFAYDPWVLFHQGTSSSGQVESGLHRDITGMTEHQESAFRSQSRGDGTGNFSTRSRSDLLGY